MTIDDYTVPHKPQQVIFGKHYGSWHAWQEEMISKGIILPRQRYERFNLFIASNTSPVQSGDWHLHAFYDSKGKQVYWKLSKPNLVCKVEGRCIPIKLEIAND